MTVSHIATDEIEMLLNNDCLQEAEEIIMPLVEKYPDNFSVWHKLAALQMKRGQWDDAINSLTRAQELYQVCEPVWFALAFCLHQLGQNDKAVLAIRQLLVINPRHAQAMMTGGEISYRAGKFWDAYQFYAKYMCIYPHKREKMLPNLLMCLQYAEQERPDDINVKLELAKLLEEVHCYVQAKEVAIRAKNVFPAAYLSAHCNDAMALMNVIATNMTVCNWDGLEDNCNHLINLVMQEGKLCEPSSFNLIGTTQEEQYINACRFTEWKYPNRVRISPANLNTDRIRIGYISSDFHEHATSYLIPGLFMHHNRERYEVYAYSTGIEDHSPARERIKTSVDKFTDLRGFTNEGAAEYIKEDKIDLLIDLKGYTTGNCNDILALRPAPVLVHYLGYPGTTGGLCDYIIADKITIPEENKPFFSEKVVYMEGCYQVNSPEIEVLNREINRKMYTLPENATVFACFNQAYKITPSVFAAWMEFLKGNEKGVLWVLEMNPEQIENLKYEATEAGVNPDRIIPMKFCNRSEHLARMNLADFYMETCLVGGHTTLSDWLKSGGNSEDILFSDPPMDNFVSLASWSIHLNRDTLFETELTTRRYEDALETIIKDFANI